MVQLVLHLHVEPFDDRELLFDGQFEPVDRVFDIADRATDTDRRTEIKSTAALAVAEVAPRDQRAATLSAERRFHTVCEVDKP